MTKIIDEFSSHSTTIKASLIPPGTTFFGEIGSSAEGLFLKVYKTIVLLRDPTQTWEVIANDTWDVYNYRPVNITITIDN